jgi:UDP-N-acetylmuramate dehydrogenase
MAFPDITPDLRARLPDLRGTLEANAPTAPLSWFRTGGPAQVLFTPADAGDLAYALANLDAGIPVFVVGLGSNLLVRDGGMPGIMIRLGKAFAEIAVEDGLRVRAGAAAPDVKVARAAAEAGIAGLSFLRGIPGTIGGALRMNGGAYGGETKDVLVEARGVRRSGERVAYTQCRDGLHLPPRGRARGRDLHRALSRERRAIRRRSSPR